MYQSSSSGVATKIVLWTLGAAAVVWLALLIAPYSEDGLVSIIRGFTDAVNDPLNIVICDRSVGTVSVLLLAYAMGLALYYATLKNYRHGVEHGSAKWGSAAAIGRRYAERKTPYDNLILSQKLALGLNTRKHGRNLNVLIIGGSGTGKTRAFAKPNLMQCNTSFVALDPKGELLRDTGQLMELQGYKVRVLDLINMDKSHCYNPLLYLENDNDVLKLVTNLFRNTTPKNASGGDPFWDKSAEILLQALIFYLHYEAPEYEQNFGMVMDLLALMEVKEEQENYKSDLDLLFAELESREPHHIAVQKYNSVMQGAGKTIKSIIITLVSHIDKFNIDSLRSLTSCDELELSRIGEEKTIIYAVIPDNDTSFNFLVGMLYTQLFQQLEFCADHKHGGRLPVPVHFVMDEFPNVALPEDFEHYLATMRSRSISVSIIIQNMAQIKALFEKSWENIVGNCDTLIYLGGNEQGSHKYVSELLGKETIDTNTFGRSFGHSGSYSTNWQIAGRELLLPDEIRMLNNKYELVFLRGERPVIDKKYDVNLHPRAKYTTDGKGKPYIHGLAPLAHDLNDVVLQESFRHYEVLTDDAAIDEYISRIEKETNKETDNGGTQ